MRACSRVPCCSICPRAISPHWSWWLPVGAACQMCLPVAQPFFPLARHSGAWMPCHGENLSLQPRLRAASSERALRWPNSHLPSFSHPTLPLHIILGIIAAVWGSRELQLLNQWAHACLDRSPSGFGTRLRLHNTDYKGSVTDMKGLGKH